MPDDLIPWPEFVGETYVSQSPNVSVDRMINIMKQTNEAKSGKTVPSAVSRPGLTLLTAPGLGVGRGIYTSTGGTFGTVGVFGSKYCYISNSGTITVKHDIGAGSQPCIIFAKNAQVFILNPDTTVAYVDDAGTVTTAATPTGLVSAAYLDGFAFGLSTSPGVIFQSSLLDFGTWDVLDQAASVAADDEAAALFSDHESLYLFGSQTTPIWYDAGASGFALARLQNAFIQQGISALYGIAQVDTKQGTVICAITGSERGYGQAVVFRPGRTDRISTYGIERILQSISSPNVLLFATSYQSKGHSLYILTAPAVPVQLCYDFNEGVWHERAKDGIIGAYAEMPAFHAVMFNASGQRVHLWQGKTDGRLYLSSETVYTDDGTAFRRERIPPILYTGARATYNLIRLDQQIGATGLVSGCKVKHSRDGGLSFDAAFTTATPGEYGEPGIVQFPQVGQADPRGFTGQYVWDDGQELAITGAWLQVEQDAP